MRCVLWTLVPTIVLLTACDPCTGISTCTQPQLNSEGFLLSYTKRIPVANTQVIFERRGGVAISPRVITVYTDSVGRFQLQAQGDEAGLVTGRLSFFPPAPFNTLSFSMEGVEVFVARDRSIRYAGSWYLLPAPAPPEEQDTARASAYLAVLECDLQSGQHGAGIAPLPGPTRNQCVS